MKATTLAPPEHRRPGASRIAEPLPRPRRTPPAPRTTPERHRVPLPAQRPADSPPPRRGSKKAAPDKTEAAETSPPRTPFIIAVLVLVAAGMVALVLLNTAINENAFRLHELARDGKELDLREQQLRRDVAELESAGSLDAAARRLGLVPAGTPAFIQLPTGVVLGVPTPAGG